MDEINLLPPPADDATDNIYLSAPPSFPDRDHLQIHLSSPMDLLHTPSSTPSKRQRITTFEPRKQIRRIASNLRGPIITSPSQSYSGSGSNEIQDRDYDATTKLVEPASKPFPLPVLEEPMELEFEHGEDRLDTQDHSTQPTDQYTPSDYALYTDAVLESAVAFYQICKTIFVVQGWNSRSRSGTVRVSFAPSFL